MLSTIYFYQFCLSSDLFKPDDWSPVVHETISSLNKLYCSTCCLRYIYIYKIRQGSQEDLLTPDYKLFHSHKITRQKL